MLMEQADFLSTRASTLKSLAPLNLVSPPGLQMFSN